MALCEYIETDEKGIANYNLFSADISSENISLNGKTSPLGFFT